AITSDFPVSTAPAGDEELNYHSVNDGTEDGQIKSQLKFELHTEPQVTKSSTRPLDSEDVTDESPASLQINTPEANKNSLQDLTRNTEYEGIGSSDDFIIGNSSDPMDWTEIELYSFTRPVVEVLREIPVTGSPVIYSQSRMALRPTPFIRKDSRWYLVVDVSGSWLRSRSPLYKGGHRFGAGVGM